MRPTEPTTFALVGVVLLVARFVAGAVPVPRAVRLDPARTLRAK